MCSHESPRGDRKRLKEEFFPLFVLFVLFGQAKRTLKEKYHKETFIFSYFCVTKSTKSHLRGLSALLKNTLRVHELVARAVRGEYVRHRSNVKVGDFAALRNFNYTTRANIAHEEAEQIRARIVCTPAEKRWAGVGKVLALTKARIFASLLQWGIDRFAKQTRSASPRQGELTDLRSKRGRRRRDGASWGKCLR